MHVTIGVTAPREVRIERLIAREGVTRDYAEARIDAQKPNEWFANIAATCWITAARSPIFSVAAIN